MFSENTQFKLQKLQGKFNTITSELNSAKVKKEKSKKQIEQLKYVVSQNSSILDNKCPKDVKS